MTTNEAIVLGLGLFNAAVAAWNIHSAHRNLHIARENERNANSNLALAEALRGDVVIRRRKSEPQ